MAARDWTTIQLVHREGARPLPLPQPVPARRRRRGPGHGRRGRGVRRLPARARRCVDVPATVTIHQGIELGRPSLLTVAIPAGDGGICVSGTAVPI